MRWLGLGVLLLGCTPTQIRSRTPVGPALAEAEARLTARGITMDAAGRRPDRLRTGYFCHRPTEPWDASFSLPAAGPLPFEHVGSLEAQEARRTQCPHLFQVEVIATPGEGGQGTRFTVQSAWWAVEGRGCAPEGEKLLGETRCRYGFHGVRAPAHVERFVYSILSGI